MKVFLGGTCNGSKWRESIIKDLECEYFNPVVPVWNDEAKKEEEYQKQICDYNLYVITPLMTGHFSIAEVTDDSNKKPDKTLLCILDEDEDEKWSASQKGSLESIKKLIQSNGVKVFDDLKQTAEFINNQYYY